MTTDTDAPPRQRRTGRVLATLAALIVAGALGGGLAVVNSHASAAQSTISQQARQISQLRALVRSEGSQISQLGNQVSSLNVPTDPLASYDQECAFDVSSTSEYPASDTNNALLWVPCTDNAQTIPQPGN